MIISRFVRFILFIGSLFAVPATVFAQYTRDNLFNVVDSLSTLFNVLITLAILVATFLFLWGIVRYITAAGDEDQLEEARRFIVWGIILLAVMIAVWGFVNILLDFIFNKDVDSFDAIPEGPIGNVPELIDRLPY
jgi:hypothetical protein